MLLTFIELQLYYRIYKSLLDNKLLSKYAPEDILIHLAEIKKIKINNKWITAEIHSKTAKLLQKLNITIT